MLLGGREMNRVCFGSHLGLWMMERYAALCLYNRAMAGNVPDVEQRDASSADKRALALGVARNGDLAIVPIRGVLMKSESKFGGTSTVLARQVLRDLAVDRKVGGVMLHVESGGGHVAGTDELVRGVERLSESKPVFAHVDDLSASAAYWVTSAAGYVTSNRMARVGSIGTYAVVYDESKAFDMAGVKVHVVSAGAEKGRLEPGVPVTKSALDDIQDEVDALNEFFVGDISRFRNLSGKALDAVVGGRTFVASEAARLGLVDGVMSFDESMERALSVVRARAKVQGLRRRGRAGAGV